MSLYYH